MFRLRPRFLSCLHLKTRAMQTRTVRAVPEKTILNGFPGKIFPGKRDKKSLSRAGTGRETGQTFWPYFSPHFACFCQGLYNPDVDEKRVEFTQLWIGIEVIEVFLPSPILCWEQWKWVWTLEFSAKSSSNQVSRFPDFPGCLDPSRLGSPLSRPVPGISRTVLSIFFSDYP